MNGNQFSDYIVFVDESGDHGMESIDPEYPVFVLAFCVLNKADYMGTLTPAMQSVKFKHFGHDNFVLHERDIRKDSGDFSALKTRERKAAFVNDLTDMVMATPFTLVCCVIRKDLLRRRYAEPDNPYHIALGFGMERVFYFLRSKNAVSRKTHVIVEKRGKKEDAELELECRRVCDGGNYERAILPFEMAFLDKKSNSPGLQLADLVARPVGIHILRPDKQNRAYDVLLGKFYRNSGGHVQGWGLKCFP